ncbi:hypothetical protein [Pleomorphovibrio marinus]|uniref:hypothetical protein n=1 Tax=Pleomorphovibrio marinus TaxID=2164132 RepID=UPI001300B5B0|nr:hypothetical protein [Pleomorphovibrio marinus]
MTWTRTGETYETKPLEGNMEWQLQSKVETTLDERGLRFRPYTGIFLNYKVW